MVTFHIPESQLHLVQSLFPFLSFYLNEQQITSLDLGLLHIIFSHLESTPQKRETRFVCKLFFCSPHLGSFLTTRPSNEAIIHSLQLIQFENDIVGCCRSEEELLAVSMSKPRNKDAEVCLLGILAK